jgi:hypothetical protein
MSTFRELTATLFMLIALGCGGQANEPRPVPPAQQPQEAASRGLDTLRKMIGPQNYKAMGFESLDEVQTATLGEPLSIYHVRLDQLLRYQHGNNPNNLVNDVGQVLYPVAVGGQVRSSIVVAKADGNWKAAQFGGPALIKALAKARLDASQSSKTPPSSYFVVRVLALNLYFLGYRTDNRLMLTPLLDDPAFKFKAGVSMPAEDVFMTILPAAKAHNGLPT